MMNKIITILLVLLSLSIVDAEAKLSTKIGKVKDGYNFWLYEPDNVASSSKENNDAENDPLFNPPAQGENPDEFFPINLDSLSTEEQIAYEMWGNELWGDSISYRERNNNGGKKPLVIFLHGRSLCGNNLDRVLRYGTVDAVKKSNGTEFLFRNP